MGLLGYVGCMGGGKICPPKTFSITMKKRFEILKGKLDHVLGNLLTKLLAPIFLLRDATMTSHSLDNKVHFSKIVIFSRFSWIKEKRFEIFK